MEHAIRRGEGLLGPDGQIVVETGKHTGRSPKDKFFVREPGSEGHISWGATNRPIEPERFDALLARVGDYLAGGELYAHDCYVGADPRYRLPVRVLTTHAWQSLFARDLFIRRDDDAGEFHPQFTVLDVPLFEADPDRDGTRTETFVLVNFARKMVLIGGTRYAGEIKKSVFTLMNYLMPLRDVLPMHCSANVGGSGEVAIFFGLSGTGKTTLSADAHRTLIGDDEHGWGKAGVFNFEGGCYAKAIKLSREAEPEIYSTTERFGTVMENVTLDPELRMPDFDDDRKTENTRIAYPLHFIGNASPTGRAAHPKNVIMLTCDAFGVLPPIAKLDPAQAEYHFLSGYTAKVAGTERGVTEPQATFSTCFGAPFMPLHPTVYGNLLRELVAAHKVDCWLVNTGWTGGSVGVGHRMPIRVTRKLLHAVLDGSLHDAKFKVDPHFGLAHPVEAPGIEADVLDPVETWKDKDAFANTAAKLVAMFRDNFRKFEDHADEAVRAAAPGPRG